MLLTEMSEEYFDKILNTNFKGSIFLTQQLVGFMEDAGALPYECQSTTTT